MGNSNSNPKKADIKSYLRGEVQQFPTSTKNQLNEIFQGFVFFKQEEFSNISSKVTESTSSVQQLSAISNVITQYLSLKRLKENLVELMAKNSSVSSDDNLIGSVQEVIRKKDLMISETRKEYTEKIQSLEKENQELRSETTIRKETEQKLLNANSKIVELEQQTIKLQQFLVEEKKESQQLISKINELQKQVDLLNDELKDYRITRKLQNSGKVVNSETQVVVQKCNKLLTLISDDCFNCIMETELEDFYLHFISNSIFETLFTKNKLETLFEDSWEYFLSTAKDDETRQLMLPAKTIFKTVSDNIVALFNQSKEISFPEIKLVWIGKNGVEFSPEFFKIIETQRIHDPLVPAGTVKRIPVFPALVVGESKACDRQGTVFDIIYQ